MKYFQQRLKEHIDAYWTLEDNTLRAIRYIVNDETGHIEVSTDLYIRDLMMAAGNNSRQWILRGYGPHASDQFEAVIFPITEATLLVAIGAIQ